MSDVVILDPNSEIKTIGELTKVEEVSTQVYQQNVGGPTRPSKALEPGKTQDKPVADPNNPNILRSTQAGVFISSMPCPTQGDKGNRWVSDLQRLVGVGIAWVMYIKEKEILDMKMDLANQYYELAREMWDHFLDTYVPCEIKEVAEVGVAPPEVDYDYDAGLYGEVCDILFNRVEQEFLRLSKLYCLCPSPGLLSAFNLGLDAMRGDMVNFSYRASEAEYQADLALWWNRRMTTLNRGRDLLSTSAKYTAMGADARDEYADLWRSVGGGAMTALSYFSNRQVTEPYKHYTPAVNMEAYGVTGTSLQLNGAPQVGPVYPFMQSTTNNGLFETPNY